MTTFTMKERFARLSLGKLPKDYKEQFDAIKEGTENFSDDDLIAVYQENFNDLYELVEKKYPDAIEKGGTVKKAKPVKVKKVKPKKEKPAEVKVPAELKKKLSVKDIEEIEWDLRESQRTNTELIDFWVSNYGITKEQAKKWANLRKKYQESSEVIPYSERTKTKKEARKKADKNIVKTRDGHEFNRKDPDVKGKKFFDENGKQWTCKGYNAKLDECIMVDDEGKEIAGCLRDMYVHNPVSKREKGNLVDECRETLNEAGYTVHVQKKGKKKVSRKEPRPEKEILKERVENTFTPITKDLESSEEKAKENKDVIEVLNRIQALFVKVFNRISNLADDGKAEKLEKIEKLLKELIED